MALPRRFLVPMDFGPVSETALDYAIDLARRSTGYLLVLHVIEPPRHLLPESISPEVRRLAEAAEERAGRELTKAAERRESEGVPIHVAIRHGAPWRVIVEMAEEQDLDLVVMGSRNASELGHPLMGSIAEKVVRMSRRPVLIVPSGPAVSNRTSSPAS
jgi:nucleotide-binding universal stress UspA family protein